MFRVGCQYKKKSYFYLSLFTVSYNIITIHRRNICDKISFFYDGKRRGGGWIVLLINWRAKRQDFQVTDFASPKLGKLQGVKRCKKLSRFQLACRLPLESLKIFPFSNLTRNFFRGEKEKNGLMEVAICSNTGLAKQSNGRGTARAQFWNNRFFAIVHIFHQNSIKSDDKIVKKNGPTSPQLKYRECREARLSGARRRVALSKRAHFSVAPEI